MAYVDFDHTTGGTAPNAHALRDMMPVHEISKLEEAGFNTHDGHMVNGTVSFGKATDGEGGDEGGKEKGRHTPGEEEHGMSASAFSEKATPNGSREGMKLAPKIAKLQTQGKERYAALMAAHTPASKMQHSPHQNNISALKSGMHAEPAAAPNPIAQISTGLLHIPNNGAVARQERKQDHMGTASGLFARMEKLAAHGGMITSPSYI